MQNTIEFGDCRETMRRWKEHGVKAQTCVTSPPYFGLRDYGHEGQLGLEQTPEEYIKAMVEVFRCVWDVLADDGTLWLNIGDSYAGSGKCAWANKDGGQKEVYIPDPDSPQALIPKVPLGLKPKDLIGIPWRVAFALQADGWYLRQDIIWHKPNPMPESVQDRCTKAHEYIFLLSKSQKYYFDNEAIAEPLASASIARLSQANLENQKGSDRVPGKTNGNMKAVYCGSDKPYTGKSTKDYGAGGAQDASATKARIVDRILSGEITTRNKRSVWTVTTKPYKGAHFATFPTDLITPCILAGAPAGGIVLDPFMGSGTTAAVAIANGRNYLGCELNSAYKDLQDIRIRDAHLGTAQMELI
jgi:DNA modification methylase